MKNAQKILYIILGILLVGAAITIGIFYGRTMAGPFAPQTDESVNENEIATYTSDALRFSIAYPSMLNSIEERPDSVIFRIKDDGGLSGFGVMTQSVSFDSTKEWLDAQPKGDSEHPGYEPIVWLNGPDANGGGLAVASEYVHVDSDGDRPIYGKILCAVQVHDGTLYKISHHNQFLADQTPSIDSDLMNVYSHFHVIPE